MTLMIVGILFLFIIIFIVYYIINKRLNKQISDEELYRKNVLNEVNYVGTEIKTANAINKLNFNNVSSRFMIDSNSYNTNITSLRNLMNKNNLDINSNIIIQENKLNNIFNYNEEQKKLFEGDKILANIYGFSNSPYEFNSNNLKTDMIYANSLNISNNLIYASNNRLNIDLNSDFLELKTGSGLKSSFIHDAYGNTMLNQGDLLFQNNNIISSSKSNFPDSKGVYYNSGLGFTTSPMDVNGLFIDDSNNFNFYSLNRSININDCMRTSNNDVIFAGKIIGNGIDLKDNQKLCIGSNCLTNDSDSIITNKFNANNLCTNNVCWSNYNGQMYTSSPITFSNNVSVSGDIMLNDIGNICLSNICLSYDDLKILKSNAEII